MMPTIGTLGSHSALQILKGARDEGLANLVIAPRGREKLYQRYPFVDEILVIDGYEAFPSIEHELMSRGVIIVPHGSFVAYLGRETNEQLRVGYYGNKAILRWEGDRSLQRAWLSQAGLPLPTEYTSVDEVDHWPVIVKQHGAAGGSGYFLASDRDALERRIEELGDTPYAIQAYLIGVTLYIHYFASIVEDRVEILSMDRRYETNVDALGRLPHALQAQLAVAPSYVVVGNSPLVLRESLLETAYEMGERTVAASRQLIDSRGLWGPFCLETILTPDMKFHVIEISCRIVAGTNLFVDGSPYAAMWYDEPMSTGRRIAREIREAYARNMLPAIIDGHVSL